MAAVAAFRLFFTILTAAAAASAAYTPETGGPCPASERAALLSFKAGITSDPASLLASWRGRDCCQWRGVRCGNRTRRVVELSLRSSFFLHDLFGEVTGESPHALRGHVSASLLALQALRHLDLSGNSLGGAGVPVPEFLGSLRSLRYLNLSAMGFDGRIPPQLGNLSELQYLDLSGNRGLYSSDASWLSQLSSLRHLDMAGSGLGKAVDWVHAVATLPALRVLRLGGCGVGGSLAALLRPRNLTALEVLDLSYNSIHGPLPDELGNMTSLRVLSLQHNGLEGTVPPTLQRLCGLRALDLSWNNIAGDVADLMERLPRCAWGELQQLRLSGANITGTLPTWMQNLGSLSVLVLSHNRLAGRVPSGIGELANLTQLDLSYNALSGAVSEDHLGKLVRLELIALSSNALRIAVGSDWAAPFRLKYVFLASCQLGPRFPAWLESQKDVLAMDVANAGIVDRIPDWFWTAFSNAAVLDMSHNRMSGELPPAMEFMSVRDLRLGSNQLTGLIPQLPRNLEILDISRNSLRGPLSRSFGAPRLEMVILFSNSITGRIPKSICECKKLRTLDLSDNLLVGEFPRCEAGDAERWSSDGKNSSANWEMFALILFGNSLSGEFPLFLKSCPNLTLLDLAYNNLSGTLPAWIGEKLPSLGVIRLRSNMFSGHIPAEIMALEALRYLDLAQNNLSGTLPQSLANLRAMTRTNSASWGDPFEDVYEKALGSHLSAGWSDDNLSVVTKGQERTYGSGIQYLVSIDCSCNSLTGQIPEEIGSLVELINLNLSWNLLSGSIPNAIGNLQSLESLDLSNNKLSGGIPSSLSNLTSLSSLNLAYNDLSGRVPSGRQLDTLDTNDPASMYIGNPGLCGHPLPKNCSGNGTARGGPGGRHGDGSNPVDFCVGVSVGVLVGLWTVFCTLLFKKTWRIACFRRSDEFYDAAYVIVALTWARLFRKTITD